MFGFVQWDSPVALLLEFLLALAVFVVLFRIAQRLEKQQRNDGAGSLPLRSSSDEVAEGEQREVKEL